MKVQKWALWAFSILALTAVGVVFFAPSIWQHLQERPGLGIITGLFLTTVGYAYQDSMRKVWQQYHPMGLWYAYEGDQSFRDGKLSDAIRCYGEAVKWCEKNGTIPCRLGNAQRLNKQLDAAIATLKDAESVTPANSFLFSRRAACYAVQEKFDEAAVDLETAQKCDKSDPFTYLLMGVIRFDHLKKIKEAEKAFRYALGARNNDPFALTLLTFLRFFIYGDTEILKRLIQQKWFPQEEEKILQAILLRYEGKNQEAHEVFNTVSDTIVRENDLVFTRELWRQQPNPTDILGRYASEREKRIGIISSVLIADLGWEGFARQMAHVFLIRSNLTRAYGMLGLLKGDLSHILSGLELSPKSIELVGYRAQLYFKQGNYVNAKKDVESYLKVRDDSEMSALLAQCLAEDQEYHAAITIINDVIAVNPDEATYKTMLSKWQSLAPLEVRR